MTTDSIKIFWEWFAQHSKLLVQPKFPASLIKELEEELGKIGHFDWEIGPGTERTRSFVVSPRGDKTLLPLSRSVIAHAPNLESWEFWPAKLPRKWNLRFFLQYKGREIEIDGKLWEFVIYRFPDGTHDLLFKPNCELPEELGLWAATVIVDGELGEEFRIEKIPVIEVVKSWNELSEPHAKLLECGLLSRELSSNEQQ